MALIRSGHVPRSGGLLRSSDREDFGPRGLAAAALAATTIRRSRYDVDCTLVAILLLGFGVNGLTLSGVPQWTNDVVFGASLVIAVAISYSLGRHRAGAT